MLQSSWISRRSAELIARYSQNKKWISIVFYCSENPAIACNLGTTGPIQVEGVSKMYLSKWALQSDKNWKCHIFDFRLIPLDRITYTDILRNHHLLSKVVILEWKSKCISTVWSQVLEYPRYHFLYLLCKCMDHSLNVPIGKPIGRVFVENSQGMILKHTSSY